MKDSNLFQKTPNYIRTMQGLQYEDIIRRAYSSQRDGRIGADAAFYNKMDRMHMQAQEKGITDRLKENQQYINAFHEVKLHLRNAIDRVLERNRLKIKPAQKKSLESINEVLRKTNFIDKDKLDEILNNIDKIFDEMGLQEA